ncbi:MAG: TlpA disulfide reductase family protein [Nitrososphaerota archaeon]
MAKRKGRTKSEPRWYITIAFVPAMLLVALLAYLLSIPPAPVSPPTQTTTGPQAEAPDFKLKVITPDGLTDREFTFSSTRGSVVFLDFAFSWCPHCNNMAPTIKRLYQEYSQKGVVFVTVMGSSGSSPSASASFLSRHGVTWTALYDERMSVFNLYGVAGTPTYFVIDREGRIVAKLIGEQPYEALRSAIEQGLRG